MTEAERLENMEALIAAHHAQRASRLDPLDVPGTERERNAYGEFTYRIEHAIKSLTYDNTTYRNLLFGVRSLDHQLESLTKWEAFLVSTRKQLCDELLSLPRYLRERSEKELQQNLEISIDSIDRGLHILPGAIVYSLKGTKLGDAMEASGLIDPANESLRMFSGLRWQGCTKDIQRERTRLTKERDTANDDLDRSRSQIDALIASTDTVST